MIPNTKPNTYREVIDCADIKPTIPGAAEAILKHSGVNINLCLHCRCCAGGCPFTAAMDYLPNQVIRLIQFDLIEEALQSKTIWTCVACNTCSAQCPMAIDIPAAMDTLRQLAIQHNIPIAEPNILAFHQLIKGSIERYGRTHKAEIMLRYKLKTRDYFSDMLTGLRMFVNHKLEVIPSRVNDRTALNNILSAHR
ncbi:MAG: 4Fe-4S dicluster domain-containing protein [Desulfobacteraceae bacterium]|nr:4Fe-4S dicluster domain-containing protein [Desulfobacteraceae bacterium]